MGQWLLDLAPWEIYLIAAPCIMLGAVLFFRGIILLLESPKRERRPLEQDNLVVLAALGFSVEYRIEPLPCTLISEVKTKRGHGY